MANDLLNKVITISGEETKQSQFGLSKKIKDEHNLTYTFFNTKQDGLKTAAWQAWEDDRLKVGDVVQIGYVQEQKEYQGKKYTQRTIRSFSKDVGTGVQNHANQTKTAPSGKLGATEPFNRDSSIIRQVSFKGVIELIVAGKLEVKDVEEYTTIFEKIITQQPLTGFQQFKAKPVTENLPVIQVDPDVQALADEMMNEPPLTEEEISQIPF